MDLGASPFVENVMRLTAMDFAIVRKDVHVLRRLEHCGYASQYMSVRCLRAFGLSKAWYPRWVSVIPRHPCPLVPNRMSRRLLFLYTNAQQYDPICKIYLDGSTVTRSIGDGRPLALLVMPSNCDFEEIFLDFASSSYGTKDARLSTRSSRTMGDQLPLTGQ